MKNIEFPVAIFGGVYANVPLIKNILSICQQYNVKTYISLGNTVGLGDPQSALNLIDKYVDFVIPSDAEEYCRLKQKKPYTFGMATYYYGFEWTRQYLQNKSVPSWFLNTEREIIKGDFFVCSYEKENVRKDLSQFKYIFVAASDFKVGVVNKNHQSIFHIPNLMFVTSLGQFTILEKSCFHIFSLEVDIPYTLDWCKKHIYPHVEKIVIKLEKTIEGIERPVTKHQTFKYTDTYCEMKKK